MIKDILIYPNDKDILTQKSEEVKEIDGEITGIVQDLIDTLKNTDTGVGISAIQIGIPKRICIIKYNGSYIPMINPVITRMREETIYMEGCLSAPDVKKAVNRAKKVWCEFYDCNGVKQEIAQGGLCSIIIQHELDHFEGWCEVFESVKVSE